MFGDFKKPWERGDREGGFKRGGFKKPWDREGGEGGFGRGDREGGFKRGGFKKPWDREGGEGGFNRGGFGFRKKPWDREGGENAGDRGDFRKKPRTAALPAEGELSFGRQPVREILRAGRRPVSLLCIADGVKDSDEISEIKALCEEKGVKIEFYRNEDLDAWVNGANHQGVVLFGEEYPYAELDEIAADLEAREGNAIVAVLDHICDPQNLGSILRTCECAGVVGVVLPTDKASPVTPAAVRASAGAAEHLKIARISNLVTALERFKGVAGTWITGLEATDDAKPYTEIDFKGKVCLVVGSEAHGICSPVRGKCDFLAKLPMNGKVNSLNAGVAAGIALYEVLRRQA